MHLKGSRHLNFADSTQDNLSGVIPRLPSPIGMRIGALVTAIVMIPLCPLAKWSFRRVALAQRDEVHIVGNSQDSVETSLFAGRALAALDLLADMDRRRYQRVTRYIRFIMASRMPGKTAGYYWYWKLCRVNAEWLNSASDETNAARALACILVHESTHGLIRSRRIGGSPALQDRIERVCRKEARRFGQRFGALWFKQHAQFLRR